MEFLMHPSLWIGLLTLIALEIILGIEPLFTIAGASFSGIDLILLVGGLFLAFRAAVARPAGSDSRHSSVIPAWRVPLRYRPDIGSPLRTGPYLAGFGSTRTGIEDTRGLTEF